MLNVIQAERQRAAGARGRFDSLRADSHEYYLELWYGQTVTQ